MNLTQQLDLMTRTHRAARELRLVNARIRAAEAIGELLDAAERELRGLAGTEGLPLERAITKARNELARGDSRQETTP